MCCASSVTRPIAGPSVTVSCQSQFFFTTREFCAEACIREPDDCPAARNLASLDQPTEFSKAYTYSDRTIPPIIGFMPCFASP